MPGSRVVPIAEAIEISEARMVLEGLCAAKAADQVDEQSMDELRDIGQQMQAAVTDGDVMRYSQLNQVLHRRLREFSGQVTASQVLERLRAQLVRHQFRLAMLPGRPSVSLPEHLAIIEAVCAKDPIAADAAVRTHLVSVIQELTQMMAASTTEKPTPVTFGV